MRRIRRLVTTIEPGVTYLALHCNAPGEIEVIVPLRAHWRTDEYRLLAGSTFRQVCRRAGIDLIGMRLVRDGQGLLIRDTRPTAGLAVRSGHVQLIGAT